MSEKEKDYEVVKEVKEDGTEIATVVYKSKEKKSTTSPIKKHDN